MTNSVKDWFVPRFETEVHHQYQQTDQRLGDTVAGGATFVGDKAYFPRVGPGKTYKNAHMAKLALLNFGSDFIEVSCEAEFAAFGLYDPDAHKYSIATAVEYGIEAANAVVRAEDDSVIRALAQAAAVGVKKIGGAPGEMEQIVTIGDYDTVADLDLISEGVAILGTNEAFKGQKVTCVTPFRNSVNMSLDPYMAKSDMKENLPWNRLGWRTYEDLPTNLDASGVDMFMYARSAVVSAYNDKMTKIDERDGASLTDILGYWVQTGAAPRNARGIIRIKSKKNFSLYRQPVPVEGLVAAA